MPKKPARSTAKPARQPIAPGPIGVEGPESISGALAQPESRPREQPTDEDIRARAYEMYLERGGHDGMDFDDWVRAERELRKK
jgi:hypothetical protein